MEYRFLGHSGLKVSLLSLGCMTFEDPSLEDQYFEIFKKCLDSGINFFDTAESYGESKSELILGKLIKRSGVKREELVISTKVFFKSMKENKPNSIGLSRKKITESIKASLNRLNLEYVDIYFCHRPDHETPLEETIRAMNWVIEQGYAFYWGTSEWSAETIEEAYGICDKLGLIKPIAEQPQYNLFVRDRFEVEYGHLFDNFRMGTTIWSPLAGGILTGKYCEEIPSESRFAKSEIRKKIFYDPFMANEVIKKQTNERIKKLKEISDSLKISLAQLAIAWTLKNKDVSTCMVGASKIGQLEESLKALDIQKLIDQNVENKIEEALGNKPNTKMNWKVWQPFPPRR